MRYRVAAWLTDEEKARALAGEYAPKPTLAPAAPAGTRPCPRTEDGHCALSLALAMRLSWSGDPVAVAPGPDSIARALRLKGRARDLSFFDVEQAVQAFTDDFDRGYVQDLAGALGVAA